jgi:hypothetical protein
MDLSGSAPGHPVLQSYEFGASENASIGGAARWIGIFAWFGIVGGVLMALAGILTMPVGLVNFAIGAVYVVIGMWFRGAAQSLAAVVTTSGSDISHLMTAIDKLGSAFKAMVVLTALAIILGITAAVVAAVAAVALLR